MGQVVVALCFSLLSLGIWHLHLGKDTNNFPKLRYAMRKNVGDTTILLDIAPYGCRVAAISVSPIIYINIGILL